MQAEDKDFDVCAASVIYKQKSWNDVEYAVHHIRNLAKREGIHLAGCASDDLPTNHIHDMARPVPSLLYSSQ